MKKTLYISFLALGLIFFTKSNAAAQAGFGIRGGVNFANVSGDDLDADSRTGFMFGAYKTFSLPGSPVAIQPEVLYSQKGFEASTEFMGEQVDLTYKLDYIEVPILAKLGFGGSGAVEPHVYAGPYIAFNINAKGEAEGEEDDIEGIKNTDFGVVAGAGLDIGALNVGARYSAGLSNINDQEGGGDVKNSVFSVVAGFGF